MVGIDFSEASPLAAEAAMQIAPNAVLHLLHAYDVMYEGKMRYAGVVEDAIDHYRTAAEAEALHRMQKFISDHGWQGRVLPMVHRGDPARTIIDQANALHADLIVMGKRERPRLEQILLGSVTESVLVDLATDLLLVID